MGVALGLLACGSTEADGLDENSGRQADSGNSGVGGFECSGAPECLERVQSWVLMFEQPETYWHTFDGGLCRHVGIIAGEASASGLACSCVVKGSGGALYAGPLGGGCSGYGRLKCVYESSEFPGCDPADATSCNAICADFEARLAADAKLTYQTEVRSARCDDHHCRSVVRIGEQCYVEHKPHQPYDCALSDEEILALSTP